MAVTSGKLFINSNSLNLKLMLEGGQSFRWKSIKENEWVGVFHGIVWELIQFEDHVSFTAHKSQQSKAKHCSTHRMEIFFEKLLSDYLRLDSPLDDYYRQWSNKDVNFSQAALKFHGIRILNQDPVENLFSFICSSNNNIARISQMIERLCELFGDKICSYNDKEYYAFPEVESLTAPSVESRLKEAGFGYRAKYVHNTAKQLEALGGAEYLHSLKKLSYSDARKKLLQFQGVGPKVGDCICLMSLGHFDAVPVDTHVFQVACQTYLPHLRTVKTITDRVYKEIGEFFRELFGPLAGWAHTILFCADLKKFQKSEGSEQPSSQSKPKKRKTKNQEDDEGIKKKHNEVQQNILTPPVILDDYSNSADLENNIILVKGKLDISRDDLHLRVTFNCGQTYRWREVSCDMWRGVFSDRVWTLVQFDDSIDFTCHFTQTGLSLSNSSNHEEECINLLREYFRLDENLNMLYKDWANKDPHFKQVCGAISGLRMTCQDPRENLFAFICSSNTTIARITFMVDHLCRTYGDKICSVDNIEYHTVPQLERLCAQGVGEDLKKAGFGFRARYVEESAKYIQCQGSEKWFGRLMALDYDQAKKALVQLPGIGAKVADCICLTALGHLNTIPVDTHVFQIAKKYYLHHLSSKKNITNSAYQEIGHHFRQLFGHYAGWAHTVLFCSELKSSAALFTS